MDEYMRRMDYGPNPYVANVEQLAMQNQNFRTAIWTGCNLQMTLMSIPCGGQIGTEMHADTDQVIRVEHGRAMVKMGGYENRLEFERYMGRGDTVFVPAGTWHNIINMGRCPLKLSSVYAPPHHPKGTVHRTAADAGMQAY